MQTPCAMIIFGLKAFSKALYAKLFHKNRIIIFEKKIFICSLNLLYLLDFTIQINNEQRFLSELALRFSLQKPSNKDKNEYSKITPYSDYLF